MRNGNLWAIVLFGLLACHQIQPKQNIKTLDFGAFTIEIPKSWTQIKERGTDSYVGRIAIDEKDTIDFDLGWYSNKLTEYDPIIMDSSMMSAVDSSTAHSGGIIFVKHHTSSDPDRYRKTDFKFEIIDGRRAKIVYPRQPGVGITGIYIDSLWVAGSAVDRFNLYGDNLKPQNGEAVLKAVRTLKFHQK
jgi:hypothetical protein